MKLSLACCLVHLLIVIIHNDVQRAWETTTSEYEKLGCWENEAMFSVYAETLR